MIISIEVFFFVMSTSFKCTCYWVFFVICAMQNRMILPKPELPVYSEGERSGFSYFIKNDITYI